MHVGKLDHRQEPDPSVAGAASGVRRWRWVQRRWRSKAWAVLACLLAVAVAPPHGWACRLAVLGDSLAAGYGVAEADAFPVRLEQALQERGRRVHGARTPASPATPRPAALARLDWVLGDQPTHLLVELGRQRRAARTAG